MKRRLPFLPLLISLCYVQTFAQSGGARMLSGALITSMNIDNLTDKRYFETQNYFESRVSPGVEARAHSWGA